MHQPGAVFLIGFLLFAGLSRAQSKDPQPNLETDALAALAKEWKNPDTAVHCLEAFRLYTEDSINNAGKALDELKKDASAPQETYDVASQNGSFLVWLATATTPDPGAPKTPDKHQVFEDAAKIVAVIYQSPGGKKVLKSVYQDSQGTYYLKALYELLNALYLTADKKITQPVCDRMEQLRACYKLDKKTDKSKFFAPVTGIFSLPGK